MNNASQEPILLLTSKKEVLFIANRIIKGESAELLQSILGQIDKELAKAPQGTLKSIKNKGTYQYYLRDEEHPGDGKYIQKSQMELIQALAQKEYDIQLKRGIEKRLKQIKRDEASISFHDLCQIYDELPPGKKILVNPYLMPIEEVRRRWAEEEYPKNPIHPEEKTRGTTRGDAVRSKSEELIANKLYEMGIPYQYEYPLELAGKRINYPDFRTMNIRTHKIVFWEHFGMMDNEGYVDNCLNKINEFTKNGYYQGKNIIYTFETKYKSIDSQMIGTLIREHLMK